MSNDFDGFSLAEVLNEREKSRLWYSARPWLITEPIKNMLFGGKEPEEYMVDMKNTNDNTKENPITKPVMNNIEKLLKHRADNKPVMAFESNSHEKLHAAYHWISKYAIVSPHFDIEFGRKSVLKSNANDEIELVSDGEAYSSMILLPLLTLATARRALLVGGPGKAKTTSAILMGVLSGMDHDTVRRSIQRGHPQLSVSDILGSPLPSDMLKAESRADIKVSWGSWIPQRVKIIDEYNRIPTKTQSALLSLLAEGYAEQFDQYIHTGRSAWFLTANDDSGGGTFPVIEALKDRIDVTIRAVPFYSNFLSQLLERLELNQDLDRLIPDNIIFSEKELDDIHASILKIKVPAGVMDFLGFFAASYNYCRMASAHFEHKNKDTLRLAGKRVSDVCDDKCPLDKKQHLCTQSENGLSTRSYQSLLHYAKALAYFRSNSEVKLEDIEQLIPWVLHEKLSMNIRSPFFEVKHANLLLNDKVAWLKYGYTKALSQYYKYQPLHDKVLAILKDKSKTSVQIQAMIQEILNISELHGAAYEDIIALKARFAGRENLKHMTK